MLQYVDDLLLSGEWEKVIKEATVKLGKKKKGLKSVRIQGILQVPLPQTRKGVEAVFRVGGVLQSMD